MNNWKVVSGVLLILGLSVRCYFIQIGPDREPLFGASMINL